MKVFYFVLLVALVNVVKAQETIPSFLKYAGTFNFSSVGERRLYLSQKIGHYNWYSAYLTCRAVGKRLLTFESKAQVEEFAEISQNNPDLYSSTIFVDGQNLLNEQESSSCLLFQRHKNRLRSIGCYEAAPNFLCEDYESASREKNDKRAAVYSKFFLPLGDYTTEETKKSYYVSQDTFVNRGDAIQACAAFDLSLAAPLTQDEYDNLKMLAKDHEMYEWIDGYRSQANREEWLVAGKTIPYEITWNYGEPNNARNIEDCIALSSSKGVVGMNDVSPFERLGFICEDDDSKLLKALDRSDFSKFMKDLTIIQIYPNQKTLFISIVDLDWTQAKLACENFGMELYTPDSEDEDEQFRVILNDLENSPEAFHIGITSKHSETWYSAYSGEELSFEFNITSSSNETPKQDCMYLKKVGNVYIYEKVACITYSANFLCQKIESSMN